MLARHLPSWLRAFRSGSRRLFPRLRTVEDRLPALGAAYDPLGRARSERPAMLEAKVEYLLDELYRLKSSMRSVFPHSTAMPELRRFQLDSFAQRTGTER